MHCLRGLRPIAIFAVALSSLAGVSLVGSSPADEPPLLGHWPLIGDLRDQSPAGQAAINHGAALDENGARFDGLDDWIEVPAEKIGQLGTTDFTISLQVSVAKDLDDAPGDLLSLYDPGSRRGFQLSLKTHSVTTSRANYRTLHFGIDEDRIEPMWTDHGRVGNAVFAFALAVHRGKLYAATCEPDAGRSGRVYRWEGENRWTDCGLDPKCNSVSSLTTFDGRLYAGTAKYRLAGSALPESMNPEPGGRVYRYESDGQWVDCGQLPNTDGIGGLAVFQGSLYAGSLYRPAGFFRYEGEQRWTALDTPNGKRVEAMCVHNGQLFASSYDEAHVFRFDGERWTDCGQVGDATNSQTYSFAVHRGNLFVGTWRSGKVFRYDGDRQWTDCGRLGEELEVMGMLVHNGRLLAGSLPSAEVFQFDGETNWKSLGRVDLTPDVMYRRAWTMAEYQGRVFVGTLPSGRVLSNSAGVSATYDEEFPSGWQHVVARRSGPRLSLFVQGSRVAESAAFEPTQYSLSVNAPLQIGRGANDFFHGQLREVRLYRGALSDASIREWSAGKNK